LVSFVEKGVWATQILRSNGDSDRLAIEALVSTLYL